MEEKYIIKQIPEDFVVLERSNPDLTSNGIFCIVKLWKKNYTTEKAIQTVAMALKVFRKNIGFAGNKDRAAVTEQLISIKGVKKERVEKIDLKDIKLEFIGYANNPISLGDLEGNHFQITVRNLTKPLVCLKKTVNYFGEQRFSKNNAEIGRAIIKKDFKDAVGILLESKGEQELLVKEFLEKQPNDFVGALKRVPWKTLQLFVHAYQSKLWNIVAENLKQKYNLKDDLNDDIKDKMTNNIQDNQDDKIVIPIVGFGTEFEDDEIKKIYSSLLEQEGISQKDFVIRQIPDLSSEGNERNLFCEVKEILLGGLKDDNLNPEKKKQTIEFFLSKGCYATEVIRQMYIN